ncbi:hypothetical protein Poli38472_014533 [Pythium oligandrum]|uniref:Dynein regulatory complex protein 10 n=1 Tax=Pythium oligandrum TaxID=41045 RepID=A0A8K1CD61_PYTOL|nr:hypothetical protein Poli38472_014533 [Pythium oligandrum]|eukprot:TMW61072.1 hypothetical protein Poli38472_014533 [Pythium oligandrum]
MNSAMDVEAERLVGVLERTVDALELLALLPSGETEATWDAIVSAHEEDARAIESATATALREHFDVEASLVHGTKRTKMGERPETDHEEEDKVELDDEEDDWSNDAMLQYPKTLHRAVRVLGHDKAARDTLRRLSATQVSPDVARFIHLWTEAIIHTEQWLGSSPEQDEHVARKLQDASLRVRELEDDRRQVAFELAAEREARQEASFKHLKSIATLREQLREIQRTADEALQSTRRTAEQDQQSALARFEMGRANATEKWLAVSRVEQRVVEMNQQDEDDERRRGMRLGVEYQELLRRYDEEMAALDAAIAEEKRELSSLGGETGILEDHFDQVDEDRHYQLEEQRLLEALERKKRLEQLNVFRLTQRLQAVVRGFLVRRRVRLEEQLKKKRKKKSKKTLKKKKYTSTKPGRPSSSPTKHKATSPSKPPTRPTSAASRPSARPRGPTQR